MGDTRTGGFQRGPERGPWHGEGQCPLTDPAPAGTPQFPGLFLGLFNPAVCLKILLDEQIGKQSTTDTREDVCVETTLFVL